MLRHRQTGPPAGSPGRATFRAADRFAGGSAGLRSGQGDPTTRRMLEEILAVEEERGNDMLTFLEQMT
jgi:bacterioferritin (cytochrome b1)